jgi:hypothetical protein
MSLNEDQFSFEIPTNRFPNHTRSIVLRRWSERAIGMKATLNPHTLAIVEEAEA